MNGALPRLDPSLENEFLDDLREGLRRRPKHIPCKYFYDEVGSALFDAICRQPEYYQTRTEIALLEEHGGEIAELMGRDVTLVEFGAGASRKVDLVLGALDEPRAYVPIDISGDFLHAMLAPLRRSRPNLPIIPVVGDFTRDTALPATVNGEQRVGFFPGSTIGNLEVDEAIAFLERTRSLLKGGGLLIGVDLVKDPAVLHAAYNDRAGVTAAFNKNLLLRANRELAGDFDTDRFAHYSFYEPVRRRIEMHLVSLAAQTVWVGGHRFDFVEGETIHTENSYKYTVEGFGLLAREAGYMPGAVWYDEDRLFSVQWLAAPA